jgi:NADH-quinone oxidoreductase subunit M
MSSVAGIPLLTLITFFPMVGIVVLLFLDKEKKETIRRVTLGVSLLEFLFSLPLFFSFRLDTAAMQFVEKVPWIPEYGITYSLGIDGISLFLVLLTTFLTFVSVLACWADIQDKVKEFMICVLFLETGMIEVFVSLDLFLFYVF